MGLRGSLRAALIYMRHNIVQAVIGEQLDVSQPTVSRAIDVMTGSSLLVWCSFGQVVMGGRAGRLLTPSVLLSAWSMSVRCRREVWER